MKPDRIPADTLRQTLDYAEQVCGSRDFHLFHGIENRRVDFRMVAGRLLDLGAPIADWRFDPRVFDVRLPGELPVYYEGDVRRYGSEAAEKLRGIRGEYRSRLTNWLFADKPPLQSNCDEFRVCLWLIQHMPSVEKFIDEGFHVGSVGMTIGLRITEAEEARPNIHRALAAADMSPDDLRKFAVFALGWFGNHSPEEAVICLERWRRLQAEGKMA